MLAPVYPFAMVLVFIGIENGRDFLEQRSRRKWLVSVAAIGLVALWLIYPVARISTGVVERYQTGAGGYSSDTWRESALMDWVRTHPLEGRLYSNAGDATYFLAGVNAEVSAYRSRDNVQFIESVSSGADSYLIWFDAVDWRDYLYRPEELSSKFALATETVATLDDGAVYQLKPYD